MFDLRACRGCLCTKGNLEKFTNISKKIYVAVTGIQIDSLDGFPSYFCSECQNSIKKALVFRRRCRRAYYVMKEIMNVRKQVTLNDIITVSRKKTNLASPYTNSKPSTNAYFTMDTVKPDIDTLIATLDKYEPEETATELIKRDIDNRSSVFHIDIPPEIDPNEVIDNAMEDNPSIDKPNEMDFEADFKDAEDGLGDFKEFDDDDDDFKEVEEIGEAEEVEEVEEVEQKPNKVTREIVDASDALVNCDIRVLTVREQKQAYKAMLEKPAFKAATFKCALCIRAYQNLDKLIKHVESHNRAISFPLTCEICKIKFQEHEELTIHIARTHLYEYICKICKHKAYNLAHLTRHNILRHANQPKPSGESLAVLKKHFKILPQSQEMMYVSRYHKMSKHRCHICGTHFTSVGTLGTHLNKHTKPSSKCLQCDICRVYYKTRGSITRHIRMWHANSFQCRKCKEIVFNGNEAFHHHNEKHAAFKPQFACPFCDKKLRTEVSLKRHKYHMHYTQTFIHHCNLCGESFSSKKSLYNHQLATHQYISINYAWQGNEEFHCEPCKTTFLSLKSYQHHALKHEHEVAKTFENACLSCKIVFDTQEEYQTHLGVSCKDLNKYPRKCPYCDLMMKSCWRYLRHHRKEHADMPVLHIRKETKLCELCGESVVQMAEHMRRHSTNSLLEDVEKYTCSLCYPARPVRGAARLVTHVVRKHTPHPYACALCDNVYRHGGDCRDHILKVHAPVLPYNCEICGENFAHGDFLKEHSLTTHNKDVDIPKLESRNTFQLKVYPHMKINMSLIDKSLLPSITVQLWDYLHKSCKIIEDVTDYVVTNDPELVPKKNKPASVKRKRKKVKEEIQEEKEAVKEEKEVLEYVEDYQLVEHDGQQYININGVLYVVENDNADVTVLAE